MSVSLCRPSAEVADLQSVCPQGLAESPSHGDFVIFTHVFDYKKNMSPFLL